MYAAVAASTTKKWACFFFFLLPFSVSPGWVRWRGLCCIILQRDVNTFHAMLCIITFLYDSSCSGLVSFLPSFFCVSSSLKKNNFQVEERHTKKSHVEKSSMPVFLVLSYNFGCCYYYIDSVSTWLTCYFNCMLLDHQKYLPSFL